MENLDLALQRLHTMADQTAPTTYIYSGTRVTEQQLKAWESSHGYRLPDDYRQFLREIGSCKLHGAAPQESHSFSVKILPLPEVEAFWKAAYGKQWEEMPEGWYAFADAQDGNFVVMDLASLHEQSVDIIDGFSESARSEAPIIARSFTEFLGRSLDDPDTSSGAVYENGRRYWSRGDSLDYGDARHKPAY